MEQLMNLNLQTIKLFTERMGVKSVLQTKPADFSRVDKFQLKVLQKDTFTSSLSKASRTLSEAVPKYVPLSSGEYKHFKAQVGIIKKNNFEGLDMVKSLSIFERKKLIKNLEIDGNVENFLLTATGNKPAVWLANVPFDVKHKDFDTVFFSRASTYSASPKSVNNFSFVMNRDKVKGIINDNLDIYRQRLNLDKKSTVDDIYTVLLQEKTIPECQYEARDIIGLTLGYPKDSSLLFHLNCCDNWSIFDDKEQAKFNLKKILMSKSSPYAGLSIDFKTHLASQIDKINPKFSRDYFKTDARDNMYVFNAIIEEPSAFNKILTEIRDTCSQLKKINKGSKKAA